MNSIILKSKSFLALIFVLACSPTNKQFQKMLYYNNSLYLCYLQSEPIIYELNPLNLDFFKSFSYKFENKIKEYQVVELSVRTVDYYMTFGCYTARKDIRDALGAEKDFDIEGTLNRITKIYYLHKKEDKKLLKLIFHSYNKKKLLLFDATYFNDSLSLLITNGVYEFNKGIDFSKLVVLRDSSYY
jgi:hypothetical protein